MGVGWSAFLSKRSGSQNTTTSTATRKGSLDLVIYPSTVNPKSRLPEQVYRVMSTGGPPKFKDKLSRAEAAKQVVDIEEKMEKEMVGASWSEEPSMCEVLLRTLVEDWEAKLPKLVGTIMGTKMEDWGPITVSSCESWAEAHQKQREMAALYDQSSFKRNWKTLWGKS